MATLSTLQKELEFNTDLVALLNVMKGIAASRFQALQKRKERFKKFVNSFQGFFELIDFSAVEHPFGRAVAKRAGVIMVTSDEGFMGGLNSHVINAALAERKNETELITLGERGSAYLKGMGEKFVPFPGVTEENKYELALKLIKSSGRSLGVKIAFLINLFNPSLVVVGGGIEQGGVVFLDSIKEMVRKYAFEEMANAVKIVPSRLGEDSACLGAASLVIRKVFTHM